MVENVAFLEQFARPGRVLADPVVNLQPPVKTVAESTGLQRSLTFDQERRLAEAFALVLATTDDPNLVGAVCIEEKADGNGLIVRAAANSGSLKGKRMIFDRLLNAARLERGSRPFLAWLLNSNY